MLAAVGCREDCLLQLAVISLASERVLCKSSTIHQATDLSPWVPTLSALCLAPRSEASDLCFGPLASGCLDVFGNHRKLRRQ